MTAAAYWETPRWLYRLIDGHWRTRGAAVSRGAYPRLKRCGGCSAYAQSVQPLLF